MATQKNRLTETILLSTYNIGFECQIRILEHEKCPLSRALQRVLFANEKCTDRHVQKPCKSITETTEIFIAL